jgi:hypothetical protein
MLVCKHTDPEECVSGQDGIDLLPTSVLGMGCTCTTPKWVAFRRNGIPTIGYYCLTCGAPHEYALFHHFFQCEQCDQYYVIDYRQLPVVDVPSYCPANSPLWIQWPPRYYLCESCDPNGLFLALRRPSTARVSFS